MEAFGRQHLMRQPDALRFGGADTLAGQYQAESHARSEPAVEERRRDGWKDAQLDLRQTKLGVVARNERIAEGSQFAATSQGQSLDQRDGGDRGRRQFGKCSIIILHRRDHFCIFAGQVIAYIDPGAKRPLALAGEDDQAGLPVLTRLAQRGGQRAHRRQVQNIERWPVDGNPQQSGAKLSEQGVFHAIWRFLSKMNSLLS